MNTDLAKELYFKELDDKAQQDNRLGVHVAAVSVVGGALVVLVRWAWPPATTLAWAGLVLWVAAAVVYILAVVWALRVVRFRYEKLAVPDQLLTYSRDLDAYYSTHPEDKGAASTDFDDSLLEKLCHAATVNSNNNVIRSERFYTAAIMLLVVVILAAASTGVLGLDQVLQYLT